MPAIPQPQRFYTPAQMAQLRPSPRWPAQQLRPGAPGHAGFTAMNAPFRAARGATPAAVAATATGQPTMRALGRLPSKKCQLFETVLVFHDLKCVLKLM